MAAKNYNTEEVKELWKQEPDDNIVFRAATKDIEEYPQEIQSIIKEEAERRRAALANAKPIPKKRWFKKPCLRSDLIMILKKAKTCGALRG